MSRVTQTIDFAPYDPELPSVALPTWRAVIQSEETMYFSPEFRIEREPGVTLDIWRWNEPERFDYGIKNHPENGRWFASREEAARWLYEAGLVGQLA